MNMTGIVTSIELSLTRLQCSQDIAYVSSYYLH